MGLNAFLCYFRSFFCHNLFIFFFFIFIFYFLMLKTKISTIYRELIISRRSSMLMGLHMGSCFQKMSTKPTFLILFSNYSFYIFLLKIIFELKRRPLSRETKLKERISTIWANIRNLLWDFWWYQSFLCYLKNYMSCHSGRKWVHII